MPGRASRHEQARGSGQWLSRRRHGSFPTCAGSPHPAAVLPRARSSAVAADPRLIECAAGSRSTELQTLPQISLCSSIATATSSFPDTGHRRFVFSSEPFIDSLHPWLLLPPLYLFEPSPGPLPCCAELLASKLRPPPPSSILGRLLAAVTRPAPGR